MCARCVAYRIEHPGGAFVAVPLDAWPALRRLYGMTDERGATVPATITGFNGLPVVKCSDRGMIKVYHDKGSEAASALAEAVQEILQEAS